MTMQRDDVGWEIFLHHCETQGAHSIDIGCVDKVGSVFYAW